MYLFENKTKKPARDWDFEDLKKFVNQLYDKYSEERRRRESLEVRVQVLEAHVKNLREVENDRS